MLRVEGARKLFHRGTPDERAALNGVSVELAPGSFVVVIGSNGAGKSTLLNAIAGSVGLDAGRIEIGGEDVTQWPMHRRARHIARVLQDPMLGTLATLAVEENLALAEMRAGARGFALALTAGRRERYRRQLERYGLGLETRLAAKAGTLSGGQRQVLALAMAVMAAPDLLLLDEHAAALDPRTAGVVMAATLAALRDTQLTTLMVTHNMQHAVEFGDRLLMMHEGAVRLDVSGAEKRNLTVEALVSRFHLADDRLLLG